MSTGWHPALTFGSSNVVTCSPTSPCRPLVLHGPTNQADTSAVPQHRPVTQHYRHNWHTTPKPKGSAPCSTESESTTGDGPVQRRKTFSVCVGERLGFELRAHHQLSNVHQQPLSPSILHKTTTGQIITCHVTEYPVVERINNSIPSPLLFILLREVTKDR